MNFITYLHYISHNKRRSERMLISIKYNFDIDMRPKLFTRNFYTLVRTSLIDRFQ